MMEREGLVLDFFFFLLGCYVYKSNVWVFNFRFVQDDF